jgi:hypothetical protein
VNECGTRCRLVATHGNLGEAMPGKTKTKAAHAARRQLPWPSGVNYLGRCGGELISPVSFA